MTNSGGNVIKNYEYDAFGVEIGKDDNDTNPFRYCAEYWDEETGTIYLRARYYEPRTGRFSAEDPIRSGLNWYTYVASRPTTYIDPSGCIITIDRSLSGNDQNLIWSLLSMLTDDIIRFNDQGILEITTFKTGKDVTKPFGTDLVRRLFNSNFTTNITVVRSGGSYATSSNGNWDNATNGVGTNMSVFLDVTQDTSIPTQAPNGPVHNERLPYYLVLAHELIHAEHGTKGSISFNQTQYVYKSYENHGNGLPIQTKNINDFTETYTVLDEEYRTVGIMYNTPEDITENALRAEHNINPRAAYMKQPSY